MEVYSLFTIGKLFSFEVYLNSIIHHKNSILKLLFNSRLYLFAFLAALCISHVAFGQNKGQHDSTIVKMDSTRTDSFRTDTSIISKDSTHLKKNNDEGFKSDVLFSAKDSMNYSNDHTKAYLFGKAKVTYEDILLTADYMEFDFATQIVYASGAKDTTGVVVGKPEFSQKSEKFKADALHYNFRTKKGKIYNVFTEQNGGYLHGEQTKRLANGQIDLRDGKYTTCDAEHPHFYLALKEGIMIPNDKTVFRSAHLVIADIPLPVWIPFGFFPSRRESTSGILMPSYGSDYTRGFSLRDGGYYFAVNQHMDLSLTGSIYTNGSWGMNGMTRYIKRYKFNGTAFIQYAINNVGEAGINQQKSKQYSINITHTQDPKANPTQTINANVNYTSSSFDKAQNYTDPVAYVQTQKSSSVNYTKTWTNFNLSAGLNASQNTSQRHVDLTAPSLSFSANRIYPFRKKESMGEMKWYENITINYKADLINQISAGDSTVFTTTALKNSQNGFHHTLPLSINFKVLKFFNITPSINYEGMLYTSYNIRTSNDSVSARTGDSIFRFKDEIHHGIKYAQGFAPSLGLSFIQPWYGKIIFGKESKIQQIRHVITPSIGFSFVPPLAGLVPKGYYKNYISGYDTIKHRSIYSEYSIYDKNYYHSPVVPRRSGSLTFGLTNNLEMKIKSDKDTVTGIRKIVLIQSLSLNSNYNIYADSFKLSNISFNGTIPVVKGLDFTFNGGIDPYQTKFSLADSTGRKALIKIDKYFWENHIGLGKITSFAFSLGYHFQSGQGSGSKSTDGKTPTPPQLNGAKKLPDARDAAKDNSNVAPLSDYNYFKVPWSLGFNYSFNYTKSLRLNDSLYRSDIIQTLGFNGDLSLTAKWKISGTSGYDFKAKAFSRTSFSIKRDLHCWVMSVDFSPFGAGRYYNLRINVLSSLLRDIKYEKREDYYDYGYGGSY